MGRSGSSKSIIFLSDMHVMSKKAICSEHPKIGNESYSPNRVQRKLKDIWNWCLDERKQKTKLLFLNGEPVDGPNRKGIGQESWTTDFTDGLRDSSKLLKEYNADKFMMTRGSGYHISPDGAMTVEEMLGEWMGAEPYDAYGERGTENIGTKRVDDFAWLDINGLIFSVTHHIGFNRWFAYKTTSLAREMAEVTLAADKWLPTEYHSSKMILVRSHVHYFVEVRYPTSAGVVTPAWKFPDRHLLRGGLGGTMPHIGTVEVLVEPNGKFEIHPHVVSSKKYPKVNVKRI